MFDIQPISTVKGKTRHGTFCDIRINIHDVFSAHKGVEDDDMNVLSLGGQAIGPALAWELIQMFLKARFSGAIRHQRRVDKVSALGIQPVAE